MPSSSLFEVEAEVGVDVEVEVWVEVGDEVKGGVEVEVGVWGSGGLGWAYFFGRVDGWLEIWRVNLISTQVVVEVEI